MYPYEFNSFLSGSLIVFIIIILLCVIPLYIEQKNYEATVYKIYNDKIEFEEGFINHHYTTIRISDIKEIHLGQGFIQRTYGPGTIRFITAANAYDATTGLWFTDIENSQEIYAKIKELYEKNNTNPEINNTERD